MHKHEQGNYVGVIISKKVRVNQQLQIQVDKGYNKKLYSRYFYLFRMPIMHIITYVVDNNVKNEQYLWELTNITL